MSERQAARFLRDELSDAGATGAPPSPEARARAIAAMQAALHARTRRKLTRRWTAAAVAVAAMAATVIGVRQRAFLHEPPLASAPAAPKVELPAPRVVLHRVAGATDVVVSGVPAADGQAIATDSRVVTPPDAAATLDFPTGTHVLLDGRTDVVVHGEGSVQTLRLTAGSLDLQVAKLAADQRFLVSTPDAEVEVRGTHFRVSVVPPDPACGGGTVTRVAVSEGVVEVRHAEKQARLLPQDQWPNGCRPPADPAEKDSSPARASPPRAPSSSDSSSLAEQNAVFGRAVDTMRSGDTRTALVAFERFVAKYPNSTLAESASAYRMRLLRPIAPALAASAAKQYLARYPKGFARDEAEETIAEVP
ncbi:MAG: FecR domain-containing protein [Polyangiaceae bacterium]